MIKDLVKRRYLIPIAIWFVCYMALFGYLEIRPPQEIHLISCGLDRMIPYVPVFVYPYLSWFPYILICAYLAVRNLGDEEYGKAVFVLTAGMNVFLLISYVWPTGLDLREGITYNTEALSGWLMRLVQTVDTPTSVFPSMHVYVTLALQYTLELQRGRLPGRGIHTGRIFAAAIILSTMFTRQHSLVDVAGAAVMFTALAALSNAIHPDAVKSLNSLGLRKM